jgi:pimeloyl-ACP methyl ester carboxylesterase/DNA-binding winged helix-turn-helix (wHTH) protein
MEDLSPKIYEFDRFRLDERERLFFDGDRPVSLAPKVFDTLLFLVENSGRLVRKEQMLETIWEDSFVEENNLAQNISYLRKVLGESKEKKFIETIPKLGYRFVAPVNTFETEQTETVIFEQNSVRLFVEDEAGRVGTMSRGRGETGVMPVFHNQPLVGAARLPAAVSPLPEHTPETHYVQNGDVNIAYQVVGSGDIDIVFVMGWVSHLEYFWKHHLFASFLNRLASFSRLILFDKRGTGLSDRVPLAQLPTLEQRMEDVRAVMDAVGSEKAVLIGVSEGGPMCSLFAASYPEKTTALVMIGTYAKRLRDDDYPWGVSVEEREAFFELMRRDWGKPVGIEERAPSMAYDEEFRDWWATYLRMGASPGAAVALTQMNAEIDVRNVLPSIRVPTLVIHRKGDMCLKVEEGRFVASLIPGCKFVELEGIDHLPFVGNQDEILDEIEEFLTGMRHAEDIDRVLATVLSVKIQPHPKMKNSPQIYEHAHSFFRRQIELFKGREVSFEGNSLLAAFAGPARAIRCACSINEAAERFGLKIKTGLHTGECEVFGEKYSGFAVDLAESIAEEACTGEILVSRTVKDLVAGSGISFADHGLKAFPETQGEWRLFTVEA